jgi:diguanylate cyclase (GGDEF)-like protein/PAS domain S-box-containing protein
MNNKHRNVHVINTNYPDMTSTLSYESIIICDDERNIIKVNQDFTVITGYQEYEVIGASIDTQYSDRHNISINVNIWSQVLENGVWQGEIWNERKNGDVYPEWRTISAIYDKDGKVNCYIVISMDLSDKNNFENRIYQLVHYDQLTKLSNKSLLIHLLNREINKSQKSNKQLAVIFLDLDGLKHINDSMGQQTADNLLNIIAQRLCHCARNKDIVARWGNDEFVIVLSDINQPGDVITILQYIHQHLLDPIFLLEQKQLAISTCMGVSLYPANGNNTLTLLQNAAIAMHEAKIIGGSNYLFYSAEMKNVVIKHLGIESGLSGAFKLSTV